VKIAQLEDKSDFDTAR